MTRTRIALIAFLVVIGILGYSAVYTVHERDQVLVLQFGKVVRQDSDPGLHFKLPFIQNIQYFDRRVLDLDDAPAEMSTTRAVFARVPLSELLTAKRAEIMRDIANRVSTAVESRYGVDLIDVRVKRLDLPPQNSERILQRMESQRRQEATGIRANGERESARIRADADRDSRITVAKAERRSQELRGEGEGKAQEIYNKAYGRDGSFFEFWISMNALRDSLGAENTRYIGPASGGFFKYFGNMNGEKAAGEKK